MGSVFYVKPSEFEVDHVGQIRAGEAYSESHDGDLPPTLFWRRMEFRHDLNPTRFDHWHPNLALIIEHARNHVTPPITPTFWTECPVEPPLNHQTVPEPASITMGFACVAAWCVAAVVLARRDSRK